ncbi:MAG: hypothetical protein AAFQ95_15355 [Cyanobacteria bacterium J06621_3]
MTSEQLLLEKWHELPEPQQQIVLAFVKMVHAKKTSQPQLSVIESDSFQKGAKAQALHIPDSERQRVMESVAAAQADRPRRIERMKVRQKEGQEAA